MVSVLASHSVHHVGLNLPLTTWDFSATAECPILLTCCPVHCVYICSNYNLASFLY